MHILQRALLREVAGAWLGVALVLLLIFLTVRSLGFLGQVAAGSLPAGGVFFLLLLKLAAYADLILPLALYLAALMVAGRWRRDNELTAHAAAGMSINAMLPPLALLGAVAAVVVLCFSLALAPLAARHGHALKQFYQERLEVEDIAPATFVPVDGGRKLYFVESRGEGGGFRNIFLFHQSAEAEGVVLAERAATRFADDGARQLVLENGVRVESDGWGAAPAAVRVLRFAEYRLRIPERPGDSGGGVQAAARALGAGAWPAGEVWRQRNQDPAAAAEWHGRWFKAAMLPALLLFAFALGHARAGRGGGDGAAAWIGALAVFFVYANAGAATLDLVRGGAAPGLLWLLHGAFLSLAVYCWRRRGCNAQLLPPWLQRGGR